MQPAPASPGRPRPLGLGRLVAITLAFIAPATSLFLSYGAAYSTAGPGVVWAYALGGAVSLLVMLCYAEVGSLYPEAGGDYALAARALGPRAGAVFAACFAFKGLALPAVLCLGAATYLHTALPAIGVGPAAAALLVLVFLLARVSVQASSLLMAALVLVEIGVFGLFLAVAAGGVHQPLHVLWLHGGHPGPPWMMGSAGILTAAGPALYALNGPQSCLYFSEEARPRPAQLGRTIMGVAIATLGVQLLGAVLGTLALPSLAAAGHQAAPLAALAAAHWAAPLLPVLALGIAVALFDAALATTMGYARVFQAIARDRVWPAPVNAWLAGPRGRSAAYLLMAAGNAGLLLIAGVQDLVALLGALVVLMYAGVAAAALRARRQWTAPPFKMPGWPLPPLVALALLGWVALYVPLPQVAVALAVLAAGLVWGAARPS